MSVFIDVEDPLWTSIKQLEDLVKKSVLITLPPELQNHVVSVLFTSDDEIQILNRDFRHIDRPTNVLSFPADTTSPRPPDEAPALGDLALGFGVIEREAIAQNKSIADHTTHLIIHGLLHLLGYDHETTDDAEKMEAHEITLLHTLGIANPYLT